MLTYADGAVDAFDLHKDQIVDLNQHLDIREQCRIDLRKALAQLSEELHCEAEAPQARAAYSGNASHQDSDMALIAALASEARLDAPGAAANARDARDARQADACYRAATRETAATSETMLDASREARLDARGAAEARGAPDARHADRPRRATALEPPTACERNALDTCPAPISRYAHACSRMLTHAHVCATHVSPSMVRMLTNADVC